MSDIKDTKSNAPSVSEAPPPSYNNDAKVDVPPEKAPSSMPGGLQPPGQAQASASTSTNASRTSAESSKGGSVLDRALSQANKHTAKQFLSAYAETWVGLSPVWLMGEAITPGKKVGTRFKKGVTHLRSAGEELAAAIATSSQDVVVIVDEKVRSVTDTKERGKTAEVLKAAGTNAILLVTTSLEGAATSFTGKDGTLMKAKIQKTIKSNGRDVVVLVDKTLRNPIVITGVARFARSKGIPHAEALLRLASLGLARILREFPDADLEGVARMEEEIEEVDAEVLSEKAGKDVRERAEKAGRDGKGEPPKMKDVPAGQDPYEQMRRDNQCVVM